MDKVIITQFGRPVQAKDVKEIANAVHFISDTTPVPYSLFAVLKNGEKVELADFYDRDLQEIFVISLDIFANNDELVFDVNIKTDWAKSWLEAIKHVTITRQWYDYTVRIFKEKLMCGEVYEEI